MYKIIDSRIIRKISASLKWLFELVLDIVLPKDDRTLELERFSLSDIYLKIKKSEPLEERWIFPLFNYKDPLTKELIKELKYSGNKKIATKLACLLYEFILDEMSELSIFEHTKKHILVPVPLYRERLFERGFNQCEILCEEIVKIDSNRNFSYDKYLLKKNKNTPPQSQTKNKTVRLKNLGGVFSTQKNLRDATIILIDDVVTTGATLSEARKTLLRAGAKNVYAFVIAH